jgi:hypothetical protein
MGYAHSMTSIEEVQALEKQMIQAELGPDPDYFEKVLSNEAILDGARNKNDPSKLSQ